MSLFKKYAWYGSAVAASALLAVALLLAGPAGRAQAAENDATCTGLAFSAPIQAAGLTETWTLSCAFTDADTNDGIAAGETITVEFPTAFSIPAAPTVTINDGSAILTTSTATAAGGIVTITTAGTGDVANGETLTITIAGITNPAAGTYTANATQSSTAGFTFNHAEQAAEQVAAASDVIWDVSITATPSSIQADGASTSAIVVTASAGAANTGSTTAVLSVTVDNGTFLAGAADGGITNGAPTLSTDGKTYTDDVQASVTTAAQNFTYKAPSATGTATITVRVTPDAGGQSVLLGTRQVTLTAPAATPGTVASGSVTTPTSASVTVNSTGTQVVTATFKDANNAAPISGGTVTVTTTIGVLSAPTNGTCTNQSCSGTLPSSGTFSVTLTGGGTAGSGTVTFSTGGISASKPVVVAGAVDTATVAVTRANPGVNTAPASGSSANRVCVTVKDTAGNLVTGQTATLSVVESGSGITFQNAAGGATFTDAAAAADATTFGGSAPSAADGVICGYFTVPSTAVPGTTYTIKGTVGTKSGTTTITIAGAVDTVTVTSDPATVAAAGTSTITVEAKDSLGNPAQDGSTLSVAASAGAVVNCSATLTAGKGTCVFAAPGTAQNVNITAVVTSGTTVKTGSATIAVGGVTPAPTPAPGGAGTFDREVPNVGVNTAVWNGGTVEQLAAATASAGGISVTVFIEGKATVLIPGAPAFVNAAFNAAFPTGAVPSGTIVLIVK